MDYGHFSDADGEYVVTNPVTPRPWINYLGNRRLRAFISQNAGGLLWHKEPHSHRITRYHYLGVPPDRPGFYVYVLDRARGTLWNPHFAPTCTVLDRFECRHAPGRTGFTGEKDGVRVTAHYVIPPDDDVMVWAVRVENRGSREADLRLCSYIEFGLLEFLREVIGWCYLKNQVAFAYDPALRAIRYDYHVFEAPESPRMVFACSREPAGFECSRDAFAGATGSLAAPAVLGPRASLGNSQLPLGGHGCGALAVDLRLAPGASADFSYCFAIGASWEETDALVRRHVEPGAAERDTEAVRAFWNARLGRLHAATGDTEADRFVNTWNPYNAVVCLDLARTISTDHMGMDGLRYRDTTQDALAVAHLDPEFAAQRMRQVFAQQTRDGGGCFAFYPDNPRPTGDAPHRSDNTVWQIYTVRDLVAETGDTAFLNERIPFRDGGDATVYEHIRLGLEHIAARCGPSGLPTLFHADWNDGLALFGDERAESVMLAMQMVYSCREFAELAERLGRAGDAARARSLADGFERILNEPPFWDGAWYGRLLLSNGKLLGVSGRSQGQIFLNPQSWSVISGVGGREGRGTTAMQSAFERLNTEWGLRLLAPPYTGVPEPSDPPLGSNPGVGENGGVFCHANTWAIMAEAMLGNAARAYRYYRQLLPERVIRRFGQEHYGREPYVYVSSIVGPPSARMGEGGIPWLTGTASWMYVAATQYLLGVRPVYDGLELRPCLPDEWRRVKVVREFRGCRYEIAMEKTGAGRVEIEVDGRPVEGTLLAPGPAGSVRRVVCRC
jgi:cellobiose phosphorylase